MRYLKLGLIATCLSWASLSTAAQWNAKTLADAEKKAIQQINQFINFDEKSELYRLPEARQHEIRQYLTFHTNQPPSFSALSNKNEIIRRIMKNYYGNQSVPYAFLNYRVADIDVRNAYAMALYRIILRSDSDSAAFAFARLNALVLTPNSTLDKERQQLIKNYGFHLNDIHVNAYGESPEVCLQFSRNVRKAPAQDWQALIHISPAPKGALGYRGHELCFNGNWQTRYEITLDPTLQSDNRLSLSKADTQTINSGIREPMLRFAGEGNVLAAGDKRHIGLSSANVDKVRVTLWHIPANNLSNSRVQDIVESPRDVSSWRLSRTLHREGAKLFDGHFEVGEYAINETVTNNIFFDDLLGDSQKLTAGIYVVHARNADDSDISTQLAFAVSSAGFSAFKTTDGLWAELRDLRTAQPVVGQTVTLYAKNNQILGTATTDDKGVAHFAKPTLLGKDGLSPHHVISDNGEHFAYLNITEKPVDLSDKGLSGALSNAPLHSWIWADRGIYRPNDTAHVMWLLKTPDGKAFADTPIWAELIRPDGKVFLERLVRPDDSGAYSFDHHFANNARQGDWTLRLSLGKPAEQSGALLANKTLPVAAITPQQIEVKLDLADNSKPLTANATAAFTTQADWLYGAPANGLTAAFDYTVTAGKLSDPRWRDWQVGLHDEQSFDQPIIASPQTTDADGRITSNVVLNNLPTSTYPLQLRAAVHVDEPNGQQVSGKKNTPITRQAPYVALQSDTKKQAKIALLNDSGELQRGQVNWQLLRVHYDYYWYRRDGRWEYQDNETRQLVTSGSLTLDGKQPSTLDLPLDDGAWVLVVRSADAHQASQTAASVPLEYGRFASPQKGNSPDKITITADKARYADGETVKLTLRAPFDGKASIKLAGGEEIIENRLVEFIDGKAELTLTWQAKWRQGLWVLAAVWSPENTASNTTHVANRRAVGLHWLGTDLSPYTLDLAMDLPESILPETTLSIPLHLSAEQANAPTWVRVAVIDDGLYRLAKPSFSNPLLQFFQKQQINLAMYDVWGSIIRQVVGRKAALRSGSGDDEGGDLSALKALPELDLQLVTFWSKPVRFDAQGNASVSMEIPRFNGRLRVMAATWGGDKLGATEKTLTVKSPLVSQLYTPPYLSPGDETSVRLRLHNTTDKPMTVTGAITANGSGVALTDENAVTLNLAPDAEKWIDKTLLVDKSANGRTTFDVIVGGDAAFRQTRFADIRPIASPLKHRELKIIGSGEEKTFSPASQSLLSRQLFISTTAPFDPMRFINELQTYPYGCSEQTTSKAWNNLLIDDLSQKYALDKTTLASPATREKQRFSAQARLANLQNDDGGFSLWGYDSSQTWLSAYIGEFLLTASQKQQLANENLFQRTLAYLRNAVMSDYGDKAAKAYAHYVLAKSGMAVQGATLRFAEARLRAADTDNVGKDKAKKHEISLSLDNVHLVAALLYHGETALATDLLNRMTHVGLVAAKHPYRHYGSPLRDTAQQLVVLYDVQSLLARIGNDKNLSQAIAKSHEILWSNLRVLLANTEYFSTQESHWLAELANRIPRSNHVGNIDVNGTAHTVTGSTLLKPNNDKPTTLSNQSDTPVYVTLTDWVIPSADRLIENGYRLTVTYEDDNGNPVDSSRLRHNQQVIAVVTVTVDEENSLSHDAIFAYPVPAGLVPADLSQTSPTLPSRTWYKKLKTPVFSENRDDRHIAAFAVGEQTEFTYAFRLRAARKGTWHAPAYHIENMYQPANRAVYPSPTVIVE